MTQLLIRLGIDPTSGWVEILAALIHVVLILALAWVLLRVVYRLLRVFERRMSAKAPDFEQRKRVETLSRALRYIAGVVVTIVASMLVLSELGISIAPILATAGVAGIAIGFGAQSLVKDYFSGITLLLENQVRQGDVVEVAGKSGLVEEVTLRSVRLRDFEGRVHFVPTGEITIVTNLTRDFAFAAADIGVAYKEDLDRVFEVMREVGATLRRDPAYGPRILEPLEIAGVEQLADSAVVVRCRFKVLPLEQWGVRREFLKRLKQAFDRNRIEIPYPHMTLYAGTDLGRQPVPVGSLRDAQYGQNRPD
jgi:small conductance mechanosensitive channel